MPELYDEEWLREQLTCLDHAGLVLFALSCSERMLPNYREFVRECGWGDESVLRETLDLAWRWLEKKRIKKATALQLQEACFEQAPGTEDFTSVFVSPALDAANSAANIAALLIEPDLEAVIEIASYGRDTVDMYIQEIEDVDDDLDLEQHIRLHPLMQQELGHQRQALESIKAGITPEAAMNHWRAPGHGSIHKDPA